MSTRAPVIAPPPFVALLVVATAWVAHFEALGAGWVGEDAAVVREGALGSSGWSGVREAFRADAWRGDHEPGAWRPLALATFALEARVWGDEPFGYHAVNLFLHGCAALLLLAVVRRAAPGRPVLAAGAALAFAAHPLLAPSVVSLVGRADLLALALGLAALRCWQEAGRGRPAFLPAAGLLLLLALLAKETALGLVGAFLVVEVLAVGGLVPALARRRWAWVGVALPVLLWAVLWPGPVGLEGAAPSGATSRLALGVEGMGRSAMGFIVPVGMVRDRVGEAGPRGALAPPPRALLPGFLLLLGAAAVLWWRAVGRGGGAGGEETQGAGAGAGFGVALVLLSATWLPAALVAPDGAPLESRFAYVAAPALFLFAGLALEALLGTRHLSLRAVTRALPALSGALVALFALGAVTWAEERVWRDDRSFLQALRARRPADAVLGVRAARRLREVGEDLRTRASRLPSTDVKGLRMVKEARENLDEAASILQKAMGSPETWEQSQVWAELGALHLARSQPALAREAFAHAVRLDPRLLDPVRRRQLNPRERLALADLYARWGRAEEALGNAEDAANHLDAAADLAPRDPVIVLHAARSLLRAERTAQGLQRLREGLGLLEPGPTRDEVQAEVHRAVRLGREVAERRIREGHAAIEAHRLPEAALAYEAAIDADPGRVEAWIGAALVRGTHFGDYRRAREYMEEAGRLLRMAGARADDPLRQQLEGLERRLREQEAREDAEERDDGEPTAPR